MNKAREIPWLRILAESTVIVVSILLAFWIDAWWDERSDTLQERALLTALLDDFHATRDEFESVSKGHAQVFQSMEQLLFWAESGMVPEESRSKVDQLLGSVFYQNTFDPAMGAVDTILSSGRLDLLKNPALVAELTRWASLVDDLNQREIVAANHFNQTIYPYLSSNFNIQDLDKGIPYPGGIPWPQQETDAYLLVPEREFHNIIYVHWVRYWNVHTRLPKIDAAIDRITAMIETELAN